MHHLSICSGIGGLDLGLQRALPSLRTIAMVEREAFCIAQLAHQMEEGALDPCPIYHDLLQFPWLKYAGLVDIVSGGFPCQPFSNAGARRTVEDERHLWPYIVEGLLVIQPKAVFFENVDGIVTAKSPGYHSVLHNVLSDLEGLGYKTTAGCYSAQEVGAPHLRKRWFILGVLEHTHDTDVAAPQFDNGEWVTAGFHGEDIRTELGRPSKLANSDGPRLERCRDHSVNGRTHEWPTRPGCAQGPNEPPRTVEPSVGRAVDGVPPRVDRLRALGNAVVPQVAEKAYHELSARLGFSW